ncbi:MAG: hypothetical protein ACI91O_000915 [Candidatus Poriferisodalaceae bacterium]|jgi:hypothetical protein
MRLLVCGQGALDPRSAVRAHVVDSLRYIGHEVVASDPRRDDLAALTDLLHRYQPEVLVHVPSPGGHTAAQIREATAQTATVSVAMHMGTTFAEAPTDLRSLSEDLRHYDLVTVPDRFTHAAMLGEGSYRLGLVEPAVHLPALIDAVQADRHGVVAVGDMSAENVDLVVSLEDAGFDVQVMGRGWANIPLAQQALTPLAYPERGTLYAGAELVIELPVTVETLSEVGSPLYETGCSQTILDAAAVATASVTLERSGLGAFFEVGTEVVTYERSSELPELVAMVCADPDLIASVGEAACNRVGSDHRWTARWTELFGNWGVKVDSDPGEDVRLIVERADVVQARGLAPEPVSV